MMGSHALLVEALQLCDRQFQYSFLQNESTLAVSAVRFLTSPSVNDIPNAEVWLDALRVTVARDAELAGRRVLTAAQAIEVTDERLNSITEVQ